MGRDMAGQHRAGRDRASFGSGKAKSGRKISENEPFDHPDVTGETNPTKIKKNLAEIDKAAKAAQERLKG